eukprot:2807011-Pyramimonas_sp.AAC.1
MDPPERKHGKQSVEGDQPALVRRARRFKRLFADATMTMRPQAFTNGRGLDTECGWKSAPV